MRRAVLLLPLVAGVLMLGACNDSGFIGSGSTAKKGGSKTAGNDQTADPNANGGDGGSSDGGANDGSDGSSGGGFPPGSDAAETAKKLPKFGMLVNDLRCGLCHVKVRGDVASTRTVDALWPESKAEVVGTWFAAQDFIPKEALTASGGLKTNYVGPEVPKAFPTLDYNAVRAKVKGKITQSGSTIVDKAKDGNVVLAGTAANPIVITNDVFISGDVVIVGVYKGNGTIYTTGNVYIPANLKANKSPFPYPDDATAALAKANEAAADKSYDGIGIVTKKSIFLGDLEKKEQGDNGLTVYNHPNAPTDRQYAALGVLNVYNWFSGGKAGFDGLYGAAIACASGKAERVGSIDVVDGFLMAENTIAGVSRGSSYSIRGGIIADHFHIITGASRCSTTPSPVHGHPSNFSYVEYDFRLATGKYLIMEHVADVIGRE